jgi:hypothetical protein
VLGGAPSGERRGARAPGVAVEPRVVHGEGAPGGQVLGERQVVGVVAARRLGAHERHAPDDRAARDHRHHHERPHPERTQDLEVARVAGDGREHRVGHLRDELRLPGSEHDGGAERVLHRRRVAALELARERLLGRVGVYDGEAPDRAVRLDDVDEAPRAELRGGERGHRRERGLVVERLCQQPARLGQKARPHEQQPRPGRVPGRVPGQAGGR